MRSRSAREGASFLRPVSFCVRPNLSIISTCLRRGFLPSTKPRCGQIIHLEIYVPAKGLPSFDRLKARSLRAYHKWSDAVGEVRAMLEVLGA